MLLLFSNFRHYLCVCHLLDRHFVKNVVGLLIIIFCYISRFPEDGTHKDGVENSKLKIVLVRPSTRMTGIQI